MGQVPCIQRGDRGGSAVAPEEGPRSGCRACVVGDVFVDLVAKVQALPQWDADTEASFVKVMPGGSALNQARSLHALGVDVNFVGALGDDEFGETLRRHVTAQGFPMEHVKVFKGLPSSVCIVMTGPSDRAFVSCYSTTDAFGTADLKERASALEGCSHLHIGGYFNLKGLHNPGLTEFVREARGKGRSVSLNVQYDSSEKWTGEKGHLRELLPLVDQLFVNNSEAENLAKALLPPTKSGDSMEPMALCQAYPNMMVLMTKGKDGCDILRSGKPAVHTPVKPVEKVVDATGAGDAFISGFLSIWLPGRAAAVEEAAKEELLHKAALMGHAASGVCIGREGACVEPVRSRDVQSL